MGARPSLSMSLVPNLNVSYYSFGTSILYLLDFTSSLCK